MPLLRFYSPTLSFEQRKIMAEEFSETLLRLTEHSGEQILIHFSPYALDQLACEGRLAHETESPVYMLELLGISGNASLRERLSQHLLSQTLDLMGLAPKDHPKIHIYYLDSHSLPNRSNRTTQLEMAGLVNP
jgi:hypothetical protein